MRKLAFLPILLLLLVAMSLPHRAVADDKIGIVLMHGKLGDPLGKSRSRNAPLVGGVLISKLRDAGYLVSTPEMCWSRGRAFDSTYPNCLAEIDKAIADLKGQGATKIVVAGQSLGGNAAIAYGATHSGLYGVIGFSPASDPTFKTDPDLGFQEQLDKARQLIAAGKADDKNTFTDRNTGPQGFYNVTLDTTPRIFLSFNDADSPANIRASVTKLTAPLLWIAGDSDPSQAEGPSHAFNLAAPNPLSRSVSVHATHLEVPDAGAEVVLSWLKELKASRQ